jgi:transcription factor MBP1
MNLDPTLEIQSSNNPHLASAPSNTSIPSKPHHTSEAASALTTQIFPLLLSKSEKLAAAFDAEINERETDVAEAERVVQVRSAEIESLKKQSMALAMSDQEDEYDARLQRQLTNLISQCESLIEDEQTADLQHLFRQVSAQHTVQDMEMGGYEDEGMEKLSLLLSIKRLKEQRMGLVREVVDSQAQAGMGDRQKEYRRLVVGALGVRDEDVDGMLPDIVGELEEWQGMEGGVIGVGA